MLICLQIPFTFADALVHARTTSRSKKPASLNHWRNLLTEMKISYTKLQRAVHLSQKALTLFLI